MKIQIARHFEDYWDVLIFDKYYMFSPQLSMRGDAYAQFIHSEICTYFSISYCNTISIYSFYFSVKINQIELNQI